MQAGSIFHDPPLTPPRPGRERRDHERHLHHAQARRPAGERRPLLRRMLAFVRLGKPAA